MDNILDTFHYQYANSKRLVAILQAFNDAIDPHKVLDDWFLNVWNPKTATGWGLDVWGRIVGVNRTLKLAKSGYFGFKQGLPNSKTFGEGVFYNGNALSSNYRLSDDAYRRLIFAKASANITDSSITSINAILMLLFGAKGRCYVVDHQDMSMTFVFDFTPDPVDEAIIASSVLPRPSGVTYTYKFTSS
ncbi:DUF2612 domain-containing protein [Swingsia samuiensis]|uniref:DUF2612 domain-containing protein n=1 Tax=Swingsia samuiensis TaxID=1293412 RepID=A0A4Y6UK04_9PROT|nr:DUF2612 domain-containing protein [Swingsia samuiensis]QDH17394.1 DUF2612 domain-containing protein [Swingsia samuiensis]